MSQPTTASFIKDLFATDIERNIEEVIKVDQTDQQLVREELAEYVATDSIRSHFRTILERYAETPNKPHEGIGVWVSGFFGSGKSSFAKYLGLALENRALAGDGAADLESVDEADWALRERLDQLEHAGVVAGGVVLHSIGDHSDAAEAILARAREAGADVIVLGTPATHGTPLGQDLARAAEGARVHVVMVDPDAERSLLAA
jgi:hypothetical protein